MPATLHQLPPGFLWGAATSSYQVEGAWRDDGKGESIWDRFSHTPGKIVDGSNGDLACDHYHRWADDIALMRSLGIQGYRFSMSWPRILPTGYGKVNPAGLDFYSRLVDGLLAAGIRPYPTLYHWDLPQALQDQGGWTVRSTAEAFVEYAEAVVRRLGDRVRDWMTLNEPHCVAWLGHEAGEHAPGHHNRGEMLAAAHHQLLGHGWAVPVLRRDSAAGAQVGIVLNVLPRVPASDSEADQEATRRDDGRANRWYLDPLSGRGYPTDTMNDYDDPMAFVRPGDMAAMAAPVDFLGVNYYNRVIVRSDAVSEAHNRPVQVRPNALHSEMGWEVYPQGLYDTLTRLAREYPFPAYYVTENGAAFADELAPAGDRVDDPLRVAYLRDHLSAAAEAISAGVPLKGYFAWSLMDNFEWSYGYSKRFGMVYVDFATGRRIPKASALWYRDAIALNAVH